MEEPTPRAFEVYVGGFGGRAYGVWWDGSRLVYESFASGYEERRQNFVSPSRAQWLRFWRTMDRIDVWSWRDRYGPGRRFEPIDLVRDGTHWSLTLVHGDREVESSGDSGGPGSDDLDESEAFGSFAQAVSRLLGGYAFS